MTGNELRDKILKMRKNRSKVAASAAELLDQGAEDLDAFPAEEAETEKKVIQGVKFDIVYDVVLNGGKGEVTPASLDAEGKKNLDVLFANVSNVMNEISKQPSQVDKITGNFSQTLSKNIDKVSGKKNTIVRSQVKLLGSADADTSTARMGVNAMLTTFLVGDESLNRFKGYVEDAFKTTRFSCSQAIKRQVKAAYSDLLKDGKGIEGVKSIDIKFKDVENFAAAEPEIFAGVNNRKAQLALAKVVGKACRMLKVSATTNLIARRLMRTAQLSEQPIGESVELFGHEELEDGAVYMLLTVDGVDYDPNDEDPSEVWEALAAAGFTSGEDAVIPASAVISDKEDISAGQSIVTFVFNGHTLAVDVDEALIPEELLA